MKKLRIAGIVDDSVVDGPGVRYTVFTQGCSHNCAGCHNLHTHDYNAGYEVSVDELIEDIASNKYIKAVTFSGGEPLDQPVPLAHAVSALKIKGYHIIIYTGYTYEAIESMDLKFDAVKYADILIDGKYVESLRSFTTPYRGSSNQRVIDIKKTIQYKEINLVIF